MSIDQSLREIEAADDGKKAETKKYLSDVRAYIDSYIPAADKDAAYLEAFFRNEADPFIRKIQNSPAIKDSEVGALLFPIKGLRNMPNQLRAAIERARTVSDEQLLQWRRNWKPFVDSQLVDKFKIGAVEKSVRGKMGELETYLQRLAEQKKLASYAAELAVLK
jgi:hypothetical protein